MNDEALRVRAQVRAALPPAVRDLRHQWLGVRNTGCYATHQVYEACDFSCTACYLPKHANRTPPLPFEQVASQLDAIRAHSGPGGNTQITAGEVTLLPVEALLRIVRYARAIGLDPMLMTHGQHLLRDISYLPRLMTEAGLQKVAIHVDRTQRGRDGVSKVPTEAELMPVRDAFAGLIRDARRTTGLALHASHTVTVTDDNLPELPAITGWWADNADAFRMLSLQPLADVGRTREGGAPGSHGLWGAVQQGLSQKINPSTFRFGDPRCNQVSLFFVVHFGKERHVVEVCRDGHVGDLAFLDALTASDVMQLVLDGSTRPQALARIASFVVSHPGIAREALAYCLRRAGDERGWIARLLKTIATGESWSVVPATVVAHHFMDRAQLDTHEGRERVAACAFRVPVGERMVSMCELNGSGLRDELNEQAQRRLPVVHV